MKTFQKIFTGSFIVAVICLIAIPVFAATEDAATATTAVEAAATSLGLTTLGAKAIGAGICVGLAAAAGAIGMGITIAKTNEAIARQPEAEGKLRTSMMLGLVFVETAIIYALVVAILIIFVL